MAQKMNQAESSDQCRKTLDRLYIHIKQKLDDNAYGREGGLLVYKKDVEDLKTKYLETKNLGPMKSQELERFMVNISDRPVEEIDRAATANAIQIQEHLLTLRDTLKKEFDKLKRVFKDWEAVMSENLKWLNEAPDKLVASKTGTVAVGTAATIVIGVGALLLAPFTSGTSLAAGAVAVAAAVGVKLTKEALEANKKVWNELSEKLMKDNDCKDKVNSTMKELIKIAKELGLAVEKVDTRKACAVSSKAKAVLPTLKAVATLGDMPKEKEDIAIKLKEKAEELKAQKASVGKDSPLGHMREVVDSIDDLVRPLLKRQYPSPS
ncbi:uncharacterized protein LOC135494574 [Lineus longissimus]|uniref:uncharacterized protein LOC135494574 n=1 Tax=Lineus longissimus TaxID=88925 RepID=UPI002B4D809A